ncbi:BrnT family toxin [Bdellovibrio sp. HCB274]|uniref:BrnT family toxin n=1 Tax=Bdellovibrio sp. HCB274 TaxID=3394361 RepID=UPI0039B6150A
MTKIHGFDWDQGNIGKVQKHGLTIKEIEIFLERNPLLYSDIKNSTSETRFFAFDRFGNKILFVVFTIRAIEGVLKFRVISARYAHKKEWEKFNGKI